MSLFLAPVKVQTSLSGGLSTTRCSVVSPYKIHLFLRVKSQVSRFLVSLYIVQTQVDAKLQSNYAKCGK